MAANRGGVVGLRDLMRMFSRSRGEPDPQSTQSWLIIGLGNPGERYRDTRHNIGFMVAERLAERNGLEFKGSKHAADLARGSVSGSPAIIALPLTFYNETGIATRRIVRYFKVSTDRLIVVCDDLDLPFGRLRIRPDGSPGGNGGLKSIIRELGTQEFTRLRVGIGRPRSSAVSHVLHQFERDEFSSLPVIIQAACDAIEAIVRDGPEAAMNVYNRDWLTDVR